MKLKFTKMHGLGNDFVVTMAWIEAIQLTQPQIRFLADRHFGIGCNQILLVEKAQGNADFRYRIFNADGGEVEQCGNGARCFVRYVHDHFLTQQHEIRIETLSGIISPKLEDNGNVTVNMGRPIFKPEDIPFLAEKAAKTYPIEINDNPVTISVLSMGNPHAVRIVEDVETAPVDTEGALIESHRFFRKESMWATCKLLIEIAYGFAFLNVVQAKHWPVAQELARGGCGNRFGIVHIVTVNMRGGELIIDWQQGDAPVWMSGPAVTVFEGEINLQSIKEIR